MSDSPQNGERREPGSGDAPMDGLTRGRAWLVGGALGVLVIAALVIAFVIGTNYSDDPATVDVEATETTAITGTNEETPATETTPPLPQDLSGPGRDAFVTSCGACHTLGDAGTDSSVGPNLDNLTPNAQAVQDAIANGGAGTGMMPPNLLSGDAAQQVADYIAAATGGG